ncbi:MAG: HEPN domain-containing protein [Planctomycetes bacterium]|nr:HEPN domain-containing protein [Planctomycetota bacterium]
MTDGQKDLIRYRISRARETLDEARVLLESNMTHGSANRIYYACFYVVTALLLSENFSSSRHNGVIALFNQHFVKTDRVSAEWGKFYTRMFDNRIEGDYAEWVEFKKQDIQQELSLAKEFITIIVELIENT